jgi:hypothetical protein
MGILSEQLKGKINSLLASHRKELIKEQSLKHPVSSAFKFASSCTKFLPFKNEDSHTLRFYLWRRFSISDSITIDTPQMESFDNPGVMLGTLSNVEEKLPVDVAQAV